MRRSPCILPALLALTFAVRPPDPALAAWSNDIINAISISTQSVNEGRPAIASDGAGGAYITWADNRAGTNDIYLTRRDLYGNLPAGWSATGNLICSAAGEQLRPLVISDGAGGAIVVWDDSRVVPTPRPFGQRVNSAGVVQWAANGLVLGPAFTTNSLKIETDMAGGAYLGFRVGNNPFAQHVTSTGALAAGYGGLAGLQLAVSSASEVKLVSDRAGGGVWSWDDPANITVLRLDSSGSIAPGFAGGGNPTLMQVGGFGQWDMAPDASGGVWIGRIDGGGAVAVTRMNGTGSLVTGGGSWGSLANRMRVLPDGIGGVLILWSNQALGNEGIYIHRLTAGGNRPGPWTDPGGMFTRLTAIDSWTALSDGAGGALIVASTQFPGDPPTNEDLLAQHIGTDASLIAGWSSIGNALCQAEYVQDQPAMAPDGEGGAIVAWLDRRNGFFNTDVYANRLNRFGEVGRPEPHITEARDVASDQGGQVRLRWTKSYVDSVPLNRVDAYWVWREVPPATAAAARMRGARILEGSTMSVEALSDLRTSGGLVPGRLYRQATINAVTVYWEWLAELGATGTPLYSYVANTAADSTAAAPARSKFRVEALDYLVGGWESTNNLVRFWTSNVDSASSKDNLAPIAPAPFLGAVVSGNTHLHWNPNVEPDLAGYRLHRGTSAGFTPDAFNLISSQPDTGHVDAGQVGFFYKLAAVDIHDNISGYTLLTPTGTTDVPGSTPAIEFALMPVRPNPSSGAATVEFALPRECRVELRIFDVSGREVRNLVSGLVPAGSHQHDWDGRDGLGRNLGPGVYLMRLVTDSGTRTQRIARVR